MDNIMDRFMHKIDASDDGCWLWAGQLAKTGGYAVFSIANYPYSAHRFIYEIYKSKIPKGLEIDHLCRVRRCVNPEHLEAVTHAENMARSSGITRPHLHRNHCKNGHTLSGDNLKIYRERNGFRRRCLVCKTNYSAITKERIQYARAKKIYQTI